MKAKWYLCCKVPNPVMGGFSSSNTVTVTPIRNPESETRKRQLPYLRSIYSTPKLAVIFSFSYGWSWGNIAFGSQSATNCIMYVLVMILMRLRLRSPSRTVDDWDILSWSLCYYVTTNESYNKHPHRRTTVTENRGEREWARGASATKQSARSTDKMKERWKKNNKENE